MLLRLTMSETEPMSVDERRKYIHKMWGRYRKGSKNEKGELLDEIEAVTEMHQKSITRILNGQLSRAAGICDFKPFSIYQRAPHGGAV